MTIQENTDTSGVTLPDYTNPNPFTESKSNSLIVNTVKVNPRLDSTVETAELTMENRGSTSRFSQVSNMTRLANILEVQAKTLAELRGQLAELQKTPVPQSVLRSVTVGDISINLEFLNGNPVINPTEAFALSVAFQNMLQTQLTEEVVPLESTPLSMTDMYENLSQLEIEEII